jgi:hypothetical protein
MRLPLAFVPITHVFAVFAADSAPDYHPSAPFQVSAVLMLVCIEMILLPEGIAES